MAKVEFVRRLTEQDVTPGTLDTAFSTRELQAAQLIPVTLYCSIVLPPISLAFAELRPVHPRSPRGRSLSPVSRRCAGARPEARG